MVSTICNMEDTADSPSLTTACNLIESCSLPADRPDTTAALGLTLNDDRTGVHWAADGTLGVRALQLHNMQAIGVNAVNLMAPVYRLSFAAFRRNDLGFE